MATQDGGVHWRFSSSGSGKFRDVITLGPSFLFSVLKFWLMTVMKHQSCPTHSGEAAILATHPSPPFIVWSPSHVRLFVTLWNAAHQALLSFTISRSLLKLMSFESVIPFSHLILCCPLLLLPSVFLSISVFSNELALSIRWPKYWSFSISPSNEYSGLISFRIDWFVLLAVQGTLKSLLQHHSLKAPILQRSTLFIVQLWHP